MKQIRTHTFKLGSYHITEGSGWVGSCDIPDNYHVLRIAVLQGRDVKALSSQIHEALHAEGCPKPFLHRKEGDPCDNLARFLVRMGWERKADHVAPLED